MKKNILLLLFTLGLCFFTGSCKCSSEKDTDNRGMESSTVDTLQSAEAETNSAGNTEVNGSDNAVSNDNNSNNSQDVATPVEQDTARTVPSGGSTSKKARFSSSGNN